MCRPLYRSDQERDGECLHRELTLKNFREYCNRWGYALISKFDGWDPLPWRQHIEFEFHCLQTYTWRKHTFIKEEFHDCDWLCWIDADCKVLNMATPIETFLDDEHDLVVMGQNPDDRPCDCGVVPHSSSTLLFRNCPWSKELLDRWWHADDTVPGWRVRKHHNCYSMGDNNWFSCKFMPTAEARQHVKVLPYLTAGESHCKRTPEQWLMHLYASTQKDRVDVLTALEARVRR